MDIEAIDLSVLHCTYICICRHSGEGRNPVNYKKPRSGTTPPNTALPATRSYLISWIPAFAGMTKRYFSDVVSNYGNLNVFIRRKALHFFVLQFLRKNIAARGGSTIALPVCSSGELLEKLESVLAGRRIKQRRSRLEAI